MSNLLRSFTLSAGLIMLATEVQAQSVSITACHQQVVNTSAILTTDLDCSADPLAVGVDLYGAELYLDGHSITGAAIGIACAERCIIRGPGTIVGNVSGVEQFSTSLRGGKVKVFDVAITANDSVGLGGDRVRVDGSTISGNGGLLQSGNAVGGGIVGNRVLVRESGVTGNLDYGIFARKIALRSATVTANGTAPGCVHEHGTSTGPCGDLISSARPSVSPTSQCDVSVDSAEGTWNICSSD